MPETTTPAPAADAPATARTVRSLRPWIVASWPYVTAALVTLGIALWFYRPWRLTPGTLAFPWGDSLSFHAWIQATIDSGWYESSDRLAFPSVQNGHTYVVTDEYLFAVIGKLLAPVAGSAAGGVLLWLVLGFPVAALLCVGLARYLGLSRVAALVPGIVLPLLPDHFLRGTAHYSLSSIWAVPLGLWLAVSLLRRPTWTGRRRVLLEVGALTAGVVIALTNAYYATFSLLLVAAAGAGAALVARSWRVLLVGIGRGLSLLVPIVVAIGLDTLYSPKVLGYTSFAITRNPVDAELYGGKIIAMLLPQSTHRSTYLRNVRHHYDSVFPNPAEHPSLGIVAALGFIGLVVWSIVAYWRRDRPTPESAPNILAGLNWVALLAFTVGGLGSIWAFVLDGGGVRVWSRMHVYIALIALLAVGYAIDRLRQHLLRVAAICVIVPFAIWDQSTPWQQPVWDSAQSRADELRAFTDEIADRDGQDAALFQLPQISFPVANRDHGPASPYDNFLPYLYSDDLRWSFGGFQGDPTADWQEMLVERDAAEQVTMLAAAGFSGIVVDTAAMQTAQPDLAVELADLLGDPDVTSTSGRWVYHDLGAALEACTPATTEALTALAVDGPVLYPQDDMTLQPGWTWQSTDGDTAVQVLTRGSSWSQVDVRFRVQSPSALSLTFPDGTQRNVAAGEGTDVTWSGAVPAEGAEVAIRTRDGAAAPVAVASLFAGAVPTSAQAACIDEAAAALAGSSS